MSYPEKIFVTGTDTDIGKTVVSSILLSGLEAGYWKPIQAGRDPLTDIEFIKKVTKFPDSHFYEESYNLSEPMSPHAAAAIDEISISFDKIHVPEHSQKHLLIEGAGGLIVPVNDDQYIIDLISYLGYPALLIAKSGLGTLNHTLLSLEALKARNITVFGVVLVGDKHESNEQAIIKYGKVDRLFRLPNLPKLTPESLKEAFHSHLKTPFYQSEQISE
ncbi:MAG: dethiobiotin synthase [Balneolaceae bacterium]|nr:dethiobiotin synthase [Balneolaceae bacterium]